MGAYIAPETSMLLTTLFRNTREPNPSRVRTDYQMQRKANAPMTSISQSPVTTPLLQLPTIPNQIRRVASGS